MEKKKEEEKQTKKPDRDNEGINHYHAIYSVEPEMFLKLSDSLRVTFPPQIGTGKDILDCQLKSQSNQSIRQVVGWRGALKTCLPIPVHRESALNAIQLLVAPPGLEEITFREGASFMLCFLSTHSSP